MNVVQYDFNPSALVEELASLISCRPVTGDQEACSRLLEMSKQKLSAMGMNTEIRSNEGFNYLVAGTKSLARSRILLQAHIDVVPAPPEMFTMQQYGDRLLGRGAYDMLFGTASFLVALQTLHDQDILRQLDMGIMLSSDEEMGGFRTAKHAARSYDCEVCFLPDAGGPGQLSTSAKGVLQIEITLSGVAGHAGRPLEYDNPIYRLATCINVLRLQFPNADPAQTVCSITSVRGGDALNQVPDAVKLTLDIRYTPDQGPSGLVQEIVTLVSPLNGRVRQLVCEPAFETNATNNFVREFCALYTKLSKSQMQEMTAPGSSDARFFSSKGIPVIMIRPDGGGLHGPSEYVSLASLSDFTQILISYLKKMGR